MANTKDTDLLIVSRGNQTYKTPVSDLMGVTGNISIDSTDKSIDLTVDIEDNINFGAGWDKTQQPLGRLYVNKGSGTVHPTWIYIGGEKIDAEVEISIGTSSGGYVTNATLDSSESQGFGYLKDGTFTHEINPLAGGEKAELEVVVQDGFIISTEVKKSGYLIDVDSVEFDFSASDGTGIASEVVLDNSGTGYTTATGVETTGGTGTGLKVDITADVNGEITDVTINTGGTGYLAGDTVTINGGTDGELSITQVSNLNYDSTTETRTFSLEKFEFEVTPTLINGGGGFLDGTYDGSPGFDLSKVYGGSSSGMELEYVVVDQKVDSVKLVKLTSGYEDEDKVYITANDPTQKYGLTVSGSEVVTWLGVAANELDPQPDEGWVLFTTIASGDTEGFVRKEGDHMYGTLYMDEPAVPAISARNHIITDSDFLGKNLTVTDYVTGGYLTIGQDGSIGGSFTQGVKRNEVTDTNPTNVEIYGVTRHHDLAGYKKTDPRGEVVYYNDQNNGEDTVAIGQYDFITKAYADTHFTGGPGGNNVEYTLNVPVQSDGSTEYDYSEIQIVETDLLTLQETVKGTVKLTPGPNIKLISDDGGDGIEIGADATRVIFSEVAPDYEAGQLWYNTTDGRIYVGYSDEGGVTSDGDTLPATDQWVDASPSAINGGDYVYRFGDQVENYLVVNGFFRAEHYDLNHLTDIRDRV